MTIRHENITIRAADGVRLWARRWAPTEPARAEVLIIHGYAEHSGRYVELAKAFSERGLAATAVDLRGHGMSDGRRGFVRRFEEYHLDIDAGFALSQSPCRFLLGHSNGGLAALDYVRARQPELAGLILTSPLLGLPAGISAPKVLLGRVAGIVFPALSLPSGIDPSGISHDPTIVTAYREDPLVFATASAGWFGAVHTAWRGLRKLERVAMPLLFAYAEHDRIVSVAANEAFAARIQSPERSIWRRSGAYHEILNELDRAHLHAQVADWILARAK